VAILKGLFVRSTEVLLTCAILAFGTPRGVGQTTGAFAVQDVRVFDGENVLEHRNVVIEDGKIALIGDRRLKAPNGAEIVDGRGRTLLPGLFDAHVHLPPDDPQTALHEAATYGVTTVFDMFGGKGLKKFKAIEAEDPPNMADLRAAGYGAVAPGSMMEKITNNSIPPVGGPEDAQAWVDARIADGSDFIKVIYDPRQGGSISLETLQAIVTAAHKRGKVVAVHVLEEEKARQVIASGADGLAHLFNGDSVGSDFGQYAAEHHVFVIPTISVLYALCGKPPGPMIVADPILGVRLGNEEKKEMEAPMKYPSIRQCGAIKETIHQLLQSHVPILAGTDTPMLQDYGYGVYLLNELKIMVDNGMTPIQVLTAATSAPARAFHLDDRGVIRPGMRADMVLVEGDPTMDISATGKTVAVWKKGVQVHR
jgi:imidazolonepropionase-like amidohydrolase